VETWLPFLNDHYQTYAQYVRQRQFISSCNQPVLSRGSPHSDSGGGGGAVTTLQAWLTLLHAGSAKQEDITARWMGLRSVSCAKRWPLSALG
jgi:hypothetical protein